jgi:hypothetical protein
VPNYNYKCSQCLVVDSMFLPMSTDPKQQFVCTKCGGLTNRICTMLPGGINGLKTFAGDWFKKTYGHELGEDGMSAAEKKADYESLLKEHKRETQ